MKTFLELNPEAIASEVRNYLTDSFLTTTAAEQLREDDELLQVLDSLQLLRMVLEIEKRFSIKIENSQLTLENLGTLRRIGVFVHDKLHP